MFTPKKKGNHHNKKKMADILLGVLLALFHTSLLPNRSYDNPVITVNIRPVIYNSMIIVPISRDSALHLHHWVIYSFLILAGPSHRFLAVYYLFLVVQGLTYTDRFHFLVPNPWKRKTTTTGTPSGVARPRWFSA